MSAIIPPKRPSRTALKLSLPSSSTNSSSDSSQTPQQPSTSSLISDSQSTPSALSLPQPPPPPGRPSLKLGQLNSGLGSLSLAIPTVTAPSPAAHGLRSPDSDDEDGKRKQWDKEDQQRSVGELLDVIRGTGAEADDGSLRPGAVRARSSSRGVVGPPPPPRMRSNNAADAYGGENGMMGVSTPTSAVAKFEVQQQQHHNRGGSRGSSLGGSQTPITPASSEGVEVELEVGPEHLEDLGRLGEGASGEVRKVVHTKSGITMAKKTIATSPNPKVHKQHLRELLFMRDCSDPHIVQFYGAFLEDNDSQIGICMEFCEGGSLDMLYKKVKDKGWRTGEKVLGKIAESVLAGLNYLHGCKIIHRDIKPSNVLVTRHGQVKLCDFGVSGELINSLAKTYVGTMYYLSPERINGKQYSINSDVWSMALTVLEVALNRYPLPESDKEPPLSGLIDLHTYLAKMGDYQLTDEPENGIKYTNAFRNFCVVSLDKDPATRPSPKKLATHPWIRRSRERDPPADLSRWVRDLLEG